MTNSNRLSPEKYDELARSYSESGIQAQNEASYNFEGADPELDFAWASKWQRIASLLRERLPENDNESQSSVQELEEVEPVSIEDLKAGIINAVKARTEYAPLNLDEERQSMFRKTRSATKTYAHNSSSRDVSISNVWQSSFFLGIVSEESRKYRVTEYDGTKQGYLSQLEPYALVTTHFDIDQHTSEMTVTQEVSPAVSTEHQVIFPSLGIDKLSSDEQWHRLAVLIA